MLGRRRLFHLFLPFLLGVLVCINGLQKLKTGTVINVQPAIQNVKRDACSEAMQLPNFATTSQPPNQPDCVASMVILNWSRPSKVLKLIETALRYPTIINEIIVWNNNPNKFPREALPNSTIVRVVDSTNNPMDRSKYEACAMASNDLCLYTDDDWDIFPYLKSMCHAYLFNPTLVHSTTDYFTFFTNAIEWVYDEPSLGFHTRFGWIGCGTLIPRAWAKRHLNILDACVPKEVHILADVLFMTLTNQYMVQSEVQLLKVRPSKEQKALQTEPETPIGLHSQQEPLQLQTGDYLVKVANATQGALLAQTDCVTRTLCKEPTICSLCTNFLPSVPRDGVDLGSLEDRKKRTRDNLPRSGDFEAFRVNPYSEALHGRTKQSQWRTPSLPQNATWGYRSPGNFTLHIRCECEHDQWDVVAGGVQQRGVTLCPLSSFAGVVDAIYFHHRGTIGGKFNVSISSAGTPKKQGAAPKPHVFKKQGTVK